MIFMESIFPFRRLSGAASLEFTGKIPKPYKLPIFMDIRNPFASCFIPANACYLGCTSLTERNIFHVFSLTSFYEIVKFIIDRIMIFVVNPDRPTSGHVQPCKLMTVIDFSVYPYNPISFFRYASSNVSDFNPIAVSDKPSKYACFGAIMKQISKLFLANHVQFSVKNYRFKKYGNRVTTPEFGNEPSRDIIVPQNKELTAIKKNGKTTYKKGLI